jgi:hypothetical protein
MLGGVKEETVEMTGKLYEKKRGGGSQVLKGPGHKIRMG